MQFKAAFLAYSIAISEKEQQPKASSKCRNLFFCAWSPVFSCFLLHVPLHPFFLVSLCLLSPWLINSALLSYFAGGDRLSHHCGFPCYGAPLVTNTDSSPSAGPKSQLEKTEIQPLKLPSEDYSKLPQLLPSPLSVSSTQCSYHNHHSQCDNQNLLAAASTAGVHSTNVASCLELVGHHETGKPPTNVNFSCLLLFHNTT